MVEVQQLRPHTVVDVKEVVGVSAGVLHHLLWQGATGPSESSVSQIFFKSSRQNNNEQKGNKLPDPPVGELVAFIRGHVAEVCEQMIERVSGQIQSPAGLVCVKKSDYVQAKVPLEPLDVRIGTVKYLRAGENTCRMQTLQKENSFFNVLVIFTDCSVIKTHTAHLFNGILQCMSHSSAPQETTQQAGLYILIIYYFTLNTNITS